MTEVRIVTDRETNMCKGYAFVGFATREIANAALNGEAPGAKGKRCCCLVCTSYDALHLFA